MLEKFEVKTFITLKLKLKKINKSMTFLMSRTEETRKLLNWFTPLSFSASTGKFISALFYRKEKILKLKLIDLSLGMRDFPMFVAFIQQPAGE